MKTPNPKDVHMGEVWEIEPIVGHTRWIAIKGSSDWGCIGLNYAHPRKLTDDEIVLRYPYRPETDPVVFEITQSEIDAVDVSTDKYGNVWAGSSMINPVESGRFTAIENHYRPMLCKIFAAKQMFDSDKNERIKAVQRMQQIIASADETTLDAFEELVPGITQQLAGDMGE